MRGDLDEAGPVVRFENGHVRAVGAGAAVMVWLLGNSSVARVQPSPHSSRSRRSAPIMRDRVPTRVSVRTSTLIESFLDMISAERGASANTMDAYRRDLLGFARQCAQSGSDLAAASPADIRSYLEGLSAAGIKPSSQSRKLSALRRFYLFLFSEGIRPDNPCATIDSPRQSRPLPKVLSAAEALALVETARARSGDSAEAKRLHCMIEMLYASGLRVSELVSLPLAAARARFRSTWITTAAPAYST